MPLTRSTVTVASRVMLPTYVVLATLIGGYYVVDPGHRLGAVHALTFARWLTGGNMAIWGWIFLGLAALMCAAFATRNRLAFAFGLCCCAVTMLLWSAMYAASAIVDPETSLLAPVWPLFVAVACVASVASLLHREV